MTVRRIRGKVGVLVACALTMAGLTTIAPALAAPNQYATSIGKATTATPTGSVAQAPRMITDQPCPADTSFIQGYVDSATAGLVKAQAIASNDADIANITTTGVGFSFNFLDIAASQGKTLVNGRYDLSVVCDPGFGAAPTAQFDAVFTISGGATPTSTGTTFTFEQAGVAVATTTSMTVAPAGSAAVGADVTLTATVAPPDAAGSVQFVDTPRGGTATDVGAPVTPSAGRATLTIATLAQGAHVLTAVFTPSDPVALSASSSAPIDYTILGAGQRATTVTLTADPADAVTRGGVAKLTAAVTPLEAGGSVTFAAGATTLDTAAVSGGVASVSFRPTVTGAVTLTATFAPADLAAFAGSTSAGLPYFVSDPLSEGPFVDDLAISVQGTKPDEGTSSDEVVIKAPRACPGGAAGVTVRLAGPGAWAAGFPVETRGLFAEPGDALIAEPLAAMAARNSLTFVPGRYLVLATCRLDPPLDNTATGFFIGKIWFYDDANWLNQDPVVVGIPTRTLVDVAPQARADLGAKVVLTATVTPAVAAGAVTFDAVVDGATTTIGTAPVADGKATFSTTTLALGLYYLTASYAPDGKSKGVHRPSSSRQSIYAIAKIVPPIPLKPAAIVGSSRVGSTLTCTAGFRNSASTRFGWFRDRVLITGAATVTYRATTADAGHRLQCRATASNPGGTVYRQSAAVRVSR